MADVRTKAAFEEKLYASSGAFDSQLKAGAFDELSIRLEGSYASAGAVGTVHDDAPWGLVGDIEVVQYGTRIRADARTLYQYASLLTGGHRARTAQTTTNGKFYSQFELPFRSILPDMGFDASGVPISIKGRWRPVGYYGAATLPTGINTTTKLRPVAETVPLIPDGGFRAPDWTEHFLAVESASRKHALKIDFEEDYFLPHLLLIFRDADGGNGTDASARTDNGISRISVMLSGRGVDQRIVDDIGWMQLRAQTLRLSQVNATDEAASVGVVLIPLIELGRPLRLPKNSSLTIFADNQSDFDAAQTAITPAAGDKLSVFLPKGLVRKEAVRAGGATAVETAARGRSAGGSIR